MTDPQAHRKRVDRALTRAADRDREGARMPDDVLAVEVRRLRDDAMARYRIRHEELLAAVAAADTRADEWRARVLELQAEGYVDPAEVQRLRAQVKAFRGVVADRDAQLVDVRAQLAEADDRATRGGRIKPYTHQWTAPAHMPPPPSASDELAPPLRRDLGPAVATVTTGEEL